ncbi:MAG TPA: hydrogenase subunit MbhD domain-containing protein [Kofleriaceae bacterium]|nr:hydrogenase subunit MbhD domain-containing protein [Kofleriaceae bacterium]
MTPADLAFDGLLALALPFLAWRALATEDLPKAVVLFIALGMLLAVAWARLDAPDIAMVEAAVGAGLTGALLVSALRVLGPERRTSPARGRARRGVLAALAVAVWLGIEAALLAVPGGDPGLGDEVRAQLPRSGVDHPVTAVLLNFRGYDTLLEAMVLLVAAIAVRTRRPPAAPRADDPIDSPFAVLVRMLAPGIVLVAGYLLWRGAAAPGGAFQAAAVLAGGGILAMVAGAVRSPDTASVPLRAALVLGPGLFLAIAAALLVTSGRLLAYPGGAAGGLILAIEAALSVSIAVILVAFFPGAGARAGVPARREARS